MKEVTFYHCRNAFYKGERKKELVDTKFIGFGCGYYEPTFIMTDKQYRQLPESMRKNIISTLVLKNGIAV